MNNTTTTPKPRRKPFSARIPFLGRCARKFGLRGKLILALLPPIVTILLVTGYASYTVSQEFINIALERTVQLHNLSVAHELEQYLDGMRQDLLLLAQDDVSPKSLRQNFEQRIALGNAPYFEVCFVPASGGEPVILVRQDNAVRQVKNKNLLLVSPNPYAQLDAMNDMVPGSVSISDIEEVSYPLPTEKAANNHENLQVIRMATVVSGKNDTPKGILFVSIKATRLRNILSWYESKESPLWSFPRSDEIRFSYFLNSEGWILFQSEKYTDTDHELTTYLAREGLSGTLGKIGHAAAFRPNDKNDRFWNVVEELRQKRSGLLKLAEQPGSGSTVDSYYYSYAPVSFSSIPGEAPIVLGGVIFVDRSQLPLVAGYKNLDVILLMTLLAIALMSFFIFWFGRILTTPIRVLAAEVNSMSSLEEMEEIRLPYSGFDITTLQESINNIIRRVLRQVEEIHAKDEVILNVNNRERAILKCEKEALAEAELNRIPEIVGTGAVIANLKVAILKAAQVEVDVLVTGETGTGKQLVAEAIHNHSSRNEGPFISINCGALDENLLLDALFGHVKGAFSEAKDDRNGAFVEANGGTLFLDEIQSASPKVQQSLLRVLASRRIKPLGSDQEVPADVRIVAATNEDLPTLIANQSFREDLYYRLKVVSVATPSLRDHKENIPLLSVYYLRQAEQLAGREELDLSKGALAKLVGYDWPGNVRELVNCITRAVVMAETDIIQAEEIRLENELPSIYTSTAETLDTDKQPPRETVTQEVECPPDTTKSAPQNAEMNSRQKDAWQNIRIQGRVTRKEYQEMVGGNLSPRTAIYDLQDLVKRGLLVKRGRGPSTTYEVVR